MRVKFEIFITVLLLLVSTKVIASSTDNFSADLIIREENRQIEGKIFVKGNRYRMNLSGEGEEISLIVDRETGKTNILVHAEKGYQKIQNTSLKSLSGNPFELLKDLVDEYESREVGSQPVNDYECSEIEIYAGKKKLMTFWESDKLGWPIKIIPEMGKFEKAELKNIKEEDVDEAMLEVPEDYDDLTPQENTEGKEKTKKEESKGEELSSEKKAVLEKLEEKGIERVSEKGTVTLLELDIPILKDFFPDWKFYRITREKPIKDGTSNGVVSDEETVFILRTIGTTRELNVALEMVKEEDIRLKDMEDVREFAKVLDALYFKDSKGENVESLGENKWAIYTGTFFDYMKGFVVSLNEDGKIVGLEFDLKIKEK